MKTLPNLFLLAVSLAMLSACASRPQDISQQSERDSMSNAKPTIMLVVGGLKSDLPPDELERRYKERMPEFRAFPGLVQKYYSYDENTEEWAGIYLWDSEESLVAYLNSDLRKSIAAAYELTEPPRIERFQIVDVLRP